MSGFENAKSYQVIFISGSTDLTEHKSFDDDAIRQSAAQRKMSRTTEINLLHPDMSSRSALGNLTNQSSVSSAHSSAMGLNTSGRKISSDWGSRDPMKINSENILSLDTSFCTKDISLKSAPPTALPSNLISKTSGFSFSDK